MYRQAARQVCRANAGCSCQALIAHVVCLGLHVRALMHAGLKSRSACQPAHSRPASSRFVCSSVVWCALSRCSSRMCAIDCVCAWVGGSVCACGWRWVFMCACMFVCLWVGVSNCVCGSLLVSVGVGVGVGVCVHVCVHVCACVCVCVCVCVEGVFCASARVGMACQCHALLLNCRLGLFSAKPFYWAVHCRDACTNAYAHPICMQSKRDQRTNNEKLTAPRGVPRQSPTLVLTGPCAA